MRRLPWTAVAIVAGAVAVNATFMGCGSETESGTDDAGTSNSETGTATPEPPTTPLDQDTGTGTEASVELDATAVDSGDPDARVNDGGRDPDATVVCRTKGSTCTSSVECCTANCAMVDGGMQCADPVGQCKPAGQVCGKSNECCTLSCFGGTCSNFQCVADNGKCGFNAECCGGRCVPDAVNGGGICKPLSTTCRTSGNPCTGNSQCCSGFCNAGVCNSQPSFCTQNGDVCSTNLECCGGICNRAAGSTLGTCATVATTGVPGCLSAGALCAGTDQAIFLDGGTTGAGTADAGLPPCGGACCSRSCAPYLQTGFLVCQPPSGCKPTGEVCRVNSDCCGWSGSPDPKQGFVECAKASSSQEFGRCNNGNSCREPGSICKPADYSCNAENNCCDQGTGVNCNSTPENCCRRDALGIPRCLVNPNSTCADGGAIATGTICATSADCCGRPCVDNKCGDICVGAGGACTTTADCCPGLPCAIAPGGSKGICGGSVLPDGSVLDAPPPQPDAGSDAAPQNAAVDAKVCALYGQICSGNADCCNNVPCTGGTCRFP